MVVGEEEGEDHETPILLGFPKDFQRISMDFDGFQRISKEFLKDSSKETKNPRNLVSHGGGEGP